jgi:hypothetical protein
MSVFETFQDEAAFWTEFSTKDAKTGASLRMKWTQALHTARRIRQDIDKQDAEKARAEPNFDVIYVYRKGNKVIALSKDDGIAQKYRELHDIPRPWDRDI